MSSAQAASNDTPDRTSAGGATISDHGGPLRVLRDRRYGLVTILSLIAILSFWEFFGRQMNPIFASYPTAIGQEFVVEIGDGRLLSAFIESIQPLAAGFLLAAVIGIPVGLVTGRHRVAEAAIGLYVTAGYSVPLVAFIPLFLLWFGLGFTVKVAVVTVMTIFPIIISTRAGVHAVPRSLIEVGKAYVASESTIMRKIIVPSTLPHIMTGLRLGVGRAVIGIVIAEFFTALGGLGGLIITAGQRFDTAALFVPIVVLMALGIGLTRAVGWLEAKVAPWHASISGGRDE